MVGSGSELAPGSCHPGPMTTFIVRSEGSGAGLKIAVKDLIDMEGLATTAGSKAVAASWAANDFIRGPPVGTISRP